jgi:hypothetical protein
MNPTGPLDPRAPDIASMTESSGAPRRSVTASGSHGAAGRLAVGVLAE